MKSVKDILNEVARNEFQSPRSKKDQKWLNKNKASMKKYSTDKKSPVTSDDNNFKAKNIKTYNRSKGHGYNPGADDKAYIAANEQTVTEGKRMRAFGNAMQSEFGSGEEHLYGGRSSKLKLARNAMGMAAAHSSWGAVTGVIHPLLGVGKGAAAGLAIGSALHGKSVLSAYRRNRKDQKNFEKYRKEETEHLDERDNSLKKLSKATLRAMRISAKKRLESKELPPQERKRVHRKVEQLRAYEKIREETGAEIDEGLGNTLKKIVNKIRGKKRPAPKRWRKNPIKPNANAREDSYEAAMAGNARRTTGEKEPDTRRWVDSKFKKGKGTFNSKETRRKRNVGTHERPMSANKRKKTYQYEEGFVDEGLGNTLKNIVSGRRAFLSDRTDGGLDGLRARSKKLMKKAPKGEFEGKFGHSPPAGMSQGAIKRWSDSGLKKAPAPAGSYGPKGSMEDKTGSGDARAYANRKRAMGEETVKEGVLGTINEEVQNQDDADVYDRHHKRCCEAANDLVDHLARHGAHLNSHKKNKNSRVNHDVFSIKDFSNRIEDLRDQIKKTLATDGDGDQNPIGASVATKDNMVGKVSKYISSRKNGGW